MKTCSDFGSQNLSNTAWSLSALSVVDRPLLDAIAASSIRPLDHFSEQDLVNTFWAVAKLAFCHPVLLEDARWHAPGSAHQFCPLHLSNTAWSCAALALADPPLLEALSSQALGRLAQCGPQHLSSPAWSFAALSLRDLPFLASIASASIATISEYLPQDVSNTAWSYAVLACCHEPLLASLASQSLPPLRDFGERNLANTSWSFARLALTDLPLLDAIASASIPRIRDFTAQSLANTAWAYASIAFCHLPLRNAISAASLATMSSQCSCQDIANTAWSCARLQFHDAPFLQSIAASAIGTIAQFVPQNVSNTAWAFAALEVRDDPLLEAIASEAIEKIAHFQPLDLEITAWSDAILLLRDAPLLAAISSAAIAKIAETTPQLLAGFAWAFAELRVRDEPLLDALSAASVRIFPEFDPQDFVRISWALAFLALAAPFLSQSGKPLRRYAADVGHLGSPSTHAFLWSSWRTGIAGVWDVVRTWLRDGVAFEDVHATDVLSMESQWRRDVLEKGLLAMVERTVPGGAVQDAVRKAAEGAPVPVFARFRADERPREGQPESLQADAGGRGPIRSSLGPKPLWSQHGSPSHWERIACLVERIDSCAASPPSWQSVAAGIERFALDKGRWLKIAGGLKSEVLRWSCRTRPRRPGGELLLELGTFVGFTAVRLAGEVARGAPVVTVEVDVIQACVARHFVDLAGLSMGAEVWTGQAKDLLPRVLEEFGQAAASFAFLDYKGNIFHEDICIAELLGILAPGVHLLADNTVSPGCPLYVWRMLHEPAWQATAWRVEEFLEPDQEDWMLLAVLESLPSGRAGPPAPASWHSLTWQTEHARRRAEGARPAQGFLPAAERAAFAQRVRQHYEAFGIEAVPWVGSDAQRESLRLRGDSRVVA